jgi:RNA polymerase sigma-70 factor (sigma-E family)
MSPYEAPRRRDDRNRAVSRSAYEGLFRDHYAELVKLAWLLVDDTGSAEEVVQEAFMRLFRHWDRLERLDAAPAYLRASVVNLSRSRLRRRAISRRHPLGPLDPEPAADLHVLARQADDAVFAAITKLPRRQRECLVLRYYADLSDPEIATTLGVSRGAVKSYMHRGLSALSTSIEDDE